MSVTGYGFNKKMYNLILVQWSSCFLLSPWVHTIEGEVLPFKLNPSGPYCSLICVKKNSFIALFGLMSVDCSQLAWRRPWREHKKKLKEKTFLLKKKKRKKKKKGTIGISRKGLYQLDTADRPMHTRSVFWRSTAGSICGPQHRWDTRMQENATIYLVQTEDPSWNLGTAESGLLVLLG